jgi:hypothetical protein
MSTIMMATLILILGAAQYALCVQAMRDLVRRPRVRGENKVLWALLILCLPIAGAIVYNWMGPTSFMHRPVLSSGLRNDAALPEIDPYPTYGPHSNVTPINAARSTAPVGAAQPASAALLLHRPHRLVTLRRAHGRFPWHP